MSEHIFRVFTDKMVMSTDEEFFDVELYVKGTKVEEGRGYLKNDYVYIYRGECSEKEVEEARTGIYRVNGKLKFVLNKRDKGKYHIDNIVEFNTDRMFDKISRDDESFIDPKDVEIINNNSEYFTPKINHNDDVWKYIIKRIIQEKKINLKNYKHLFPSQYTLNNMKGALEKDTKMSVNYFLDWCEVLGIDWEISVRDSGQDKHNPLPEPFSVTNYDVW